jgi:hypothetical protein
VDIVGRGGEGKGRKEEETRGKKKGTRKTEHKSQKESEAKIERGSVEIETISRNHCKRPVLVF